MGSGDSVEPGFSGCARNPANEIPPGLVTILIFGKKTLLSRAVWFAFWFQLVTAHGFADSSLGRAFQASVEKGKTQSGATADRRTPANAKKSAPSSTPSPSPAASRPRAKRPKKKPASEAASEEKRPNAEEPVSAVSPPPAETPEEKVAPAAQDEVLPSSASAPAENSREKAGAPSVEEKPAPPPPSSSNAPPLELRQLRYFVALAEEENVARASAKLRVSRTAMDRQLRDLEKQLGATLLERKGESARLTDEGRFFVDEARAVLQRADAAVGAMRAASRDASGKFIPPTPPPPADSPSLVAIPANPTDPTIADAPVLFPPGEVRMPQLFPPPALPTDASSSATPLLVEAAPASPAPESAVETAPEAKPEEHRYRVSKITYEFGAPGTKPNPRLPAMAKIAQGKVALGRTKDGLTAPTRGDKKEEISVIGGKVETYYGDALLALYNGVVENLNKKFGIYGVYVFAAQDQIDPVTLEDKRDPKNTDLTVRVFVSEVSEVRTIARKVPFGASDQPEINDRKHQRIRSKSPITVASSEKGGGLLEKARLQNYLDRINRFQGRRVDAALNASGEQGRVILDYLVREQKHFSLYAQTSNTGSDQTGEWRSRVGTEYRQLAGLDDTLRLEYGTSNFKDYMTGLASYEFTPIFPDYLKLKLYGNWGRYSASDVGLDLISFSGESFTGGLAMTWTPAYVKGFPVDIYIGAEWLNTSVKNSAIGGGSTDFFLPYAGISTDMSTDKFTLALNAELQKNVPGVGGTDSGIDLDVLGRSNTDNEFTIGKWNLLFSFYLEPLIFGKQWEEQKTWWKSTRAHELALSFRGQVAFDKARLVPQLEYVADGLYTVRGYPESYVSGDTALVGTFEYRFHIPRAFKPANQPGGKKKKEGEKPNPSNTAPPSAARGQGFAFRPPGIASGADWDLIFRGFVDYGEVSSNNPFSYEPDRTLLGAGVGLELQLFKPVFASARIDWGYALLGIGDAASNRVDRGDARLNLSFSTAW